MTGSMHFMRPVFFASFCFLVLLGSLLVGQRRHGPSPLDTLGKEPVQSEGWAVLEKARSLTFGGDFEFRFQLKVMPRREKSRYVDGLMLGTWNELGPLSRLDLTVEKGGINEDGSLRVGKTERFLLQSGLFAKAWRRAESSEIPEQISSDRFFDRLAGSEFTPFDVFMPFLHWSHFKYEGTTTSRSRKVHVFWMSPPEEDPALGQVVSGVRIFVDDQFNAITKAETYGPEEALLKTLTIVEIKKESGEWYPKHIDVRNEVTRDKTRFSVTAATMGIEVPQSVFSVGALSQSLFDLKAQPERVPNTEL